MGDVVSFLASLLEYLNILTTSPPRSWILGSSHLYFVQDIDGGFVKVNIRVEDKNIETTINMDTSYR